MVREPSYSLIGQPTTERAFSGSSVDTPQKGIDKLRGWVDKMKKLKSLLLETRSKQTGRNSFVLGLSLPFKKIKPPAGCRIPDPPL